MRIQMVLHHANLAGSGILRRQCLTKPGVFPFSPLCVDSPQPAARERFAGGQPGKQKP